MGRLRHRRKAFRAEGSNLVPLQASGTGPNATASNNFTPNLTGVDAGDLMLSFIVLRDGSFTVNSVPSGWTLEANLNVGTGTTDPNVYCYSKISGGSEGSPAWGFTGAAFRSGQVVKIAGATTFDDFATNGNSDALGVVTVASGGIAIGFLGLCDTGDTSSSEPPSGYAEIRDRNGATRSGLNVSWVDPGTGDTPAASFTRNDTGNIRATIHVTLS